MKYIKTYERSINKNYLMNEDEMVVLIKSSLDTDTYGFKVGKIYHISLVDDRYDERYPYQISTSDGLNSVWVRENQIRKATDLDKDIIKYNL